MSELAPESELIRLLANRDAHDLARPLLRDYVTLPDAWAVVEDITEWYKVNPSATELDWDAFLAWARVAQHSTWKPDKRLVYESLAKTAAAITAANPSILERFRELDAAAQIRTLADTALAKQGSGALDQCGPILDQYRQMVGGAGPEDLVTDDLDELLDQTIRVGGMEWRVEDLNIATGPLRRGDLVVVGARPEVGKTTFLCSELTYMLPQLPEGQNALIVNNEERGQKIKLRCISSALNLTLADILADPVATKTAYAAFLAGRKIDLVSRPSVSVSDVERLCRKGNYGIIAFNVLDKMWGFADMEGVERSARLAQWARELADKYGVVFCLSQADASAEGQRTLDQSQLYGSKTKVQGEADILLMVGKEPVSGESRWINVCKNKMPSGPRVNPALSHGQFEVRMDAERARYSSIAYRKSGKP